jgi:uncharacterized protein GlcG (DUF336 family)
MSGEVLVQRTISVDLALELAKASLDEARKRNYSVAIAVTDRSGRLLVQLRTDNAGPHLLDSSRRKAYTAASANTRTSIMAKAIDERSGVPDPHLVYLNEVLMVGGGVPIHAGSELAGAVGIAGSPGSIHDEECADAGIARISDRLR